MPKKRSKPKEPERIEIIEAAREQSDDEEAQQQHAEFLKVWSAKMTETDGLLMRHPRAIGGRPRRGRARRVPQRVRADGGGGAAGDGDAQPALPIRRQYQV